MSNGRQPGQPMWLLTEKKELLVHYLELTNAQEQLIAQEDVDGLLENIKSRQHLIDELEKVEKQLKDARTADGGWLSGGSGELKDMQQEVMKLGQMIQVKDREIQTKAVEKRDFFSAEIRKLRNKRQGTVEYAKSSYAGYTTSQMFDKIQ